VPHLRKSRNSATPQIVIRARNEVFQQLTAEENLLKDVEIEGALSTTRALDIFAIRITG
jgi:hypothetical protein